MRADSRYNRDALFMIQNYAASSDIFVVMIKTPEDQCTRYASLSAVDALAWRLEQLPGVESTTSMAALSKIATAGYNEGNFKWYELIPNDGALGAVQTRAPRELFNQGCSMLSLYVYLADHKADTLNRLVEASEKFISEHQVPEVKFMLVAGSAGIEAATNIVVKKSMREMLFWVYGAVSLLCLLTFRSWRAILCAMLSLMLTSILCEALMVGLGMGGKSRDTAGHRTGRGHWHRLRALCLECDSGSNACRRHPGSGVLPGAAVHRQSSVADRHDAGGRSVDLGVLTDQVPGRHGDSAGFHVHGEHAWCLDPVAGLGLVAAAAEGPRKKA